MKMKTAVDALDDRFYGKKSCSEREQLEIIEESSLETIIAAAETMRTARDEKRRALK